MTDELRILYQSFGPPENEGYLDRLANTVSDAGRLFGVRVEIGTLSRTLLSQKQHRAFHLAAGAHLLEQVYAAQAKGYAAAVIGNIQDPALFECRQVCDMPVVGLLDSALSGARAFAASVGLVTSSALTIPLLRERVRQYGDESIVRAWRSAETPLTSLLAAFTDPARAEQVWSAFASAAGAAVADGAELLIPASGMLASFLSVRAGDRAGWDLGLGAPVLNPIYSAVAAASGAARLARSGLPISRTGTYAAPDRQALVDFFGPRG